jgi:hypothetical protein
MKFARIVVIVAVLSQAALAYGADSCEGVISNRTGSENPSSFAPDRYIVMFNDPAIGVDRVVLPPDPALKGTVPFGEPASGQTREQVAQLLNLRGAVLFILDALNGIVLATDEAEAKALSCDPRVKYVEQDQYLYLDIDTPTTPPLNPAPVHITDFHASGSDTRPFYIRETQTLQVPLVDTSDQAGVYQRAELQYGTDGLWRLLKNTQGTLASHLNTVELVKTGSFPVQVFLRISGDFPSSCNVQPAPQPVVSQQSNHFSIYLYEGASDTSSIMCIPALAPFQITLALPVYGLETGVYHYKVNGEFAGSFTLAQPNELN